MTRKRGGIYTNDLVTIDKDGWIKDRVPLLYFNSPDYSTSEVYYYGKILSGVISPYDLKILNLQDGDIPAITDGKLVWRYKSIFEGADPESLKYLTGGLYIDKNSCYLTVPFSIVKLSECNPKKIHMISKNFSGWDSTGRYSDDSHLYNADGEIVKN